MNGPVMSILEAHVEEERWPDLRRAYEEVAQNLPSGIVQTFLVQGKSDPTLWRITTVWQNLESLEKLRATGETPGGVLVFRAAGAEPTLKVFDIAAHRSRG